MDEKIKALYADYPQQPYFSPDRDLSQEVLTYKVIPRRNLEVLTEGLMAGDIILLWRVAFGTFTTESVFPKYLEFTYGINGKAHLQMLVENDFVYQETAFASLDHVTATVKKAILKARGIEGLSKMKSDDLDQALKKYLSEEELGAYFQVRGYALTPKGEVALATHQAVIDRHPKKKF